MKNPTLYRNDNKFKSKDPRKQKKETRTTHPINRQTPTSNRNLPIAHFQFLQERRGNNYFLAISNPSNTFYVMETETPFPSSSAHFDLEGKRSRNEL